MINIEKSSIEPMEKLTGRLKKGKANVQYFGQTEVTFLWGQTEASFDSSSVHIGC